MPWTEKNWHFWKLKFERANERNYQEWHCHKSRPVTNEEYWLREKETVCKLGNQDKIWTMLDSPKFKTAIPAISPKFGGALASDFRQISEILPPISDKSIKFAL